MQTGAARYVDVDQAARDGRQRRPQHQRQLGQMSRLHVTALQASADGENRHRCCKPARTGELIAGVVPAS